MTHEKLNENETVSGCEKCNQTGLLKVILIRHQYGKVYVLNPNDFDTQKNWIIQNYKMLYFTPDYLPCSCSAGNVINSRGGVNWLEPEKRYTVFSRCFSYSDPAEENIMQAQWVKYLQTMTDAYPYIPRDLREFPTREQIEAKKANNCDPSELIMY